MSIKCVCSAIKIQYTREAQAELLWSYSTSQNSLVLKFLKVALTESVNKDGQGKNVIKMIKDWIIMNMLVAECVRLAGDGQHW